MARKVLTPLPPPSNLALSIDLSACCPFWASFDIQNILSLPPHTSPSGLRPLLSVQWNFPSREPRALSPTRHSLPFYFAWCPLSLGIQASEDSCSCYPCVQLLLKSRAAWISSVPSQDWFFSFIPETLAGRCQLWAQCQLPSVCPWCFCLGALCTWAPAEAHTPDNNPIIPSDGFSHYLTLFVPSGVPCSHFSA